MMQFSSNQEDRTKSKSPWWVKITTAQPECVYYFGPFDSQPEATKFQFGYVEDLVAEEARGIGIEIEQNSPELLTISPE